jgi:hypothetical protein
MFSDIPPSGRWAGYYLYGHSGVKHRMSLTLSFSREGRIEGDGVDDIAQFVIVGRFDCATSIANWTKTYIGRHSVAYSGVYCQKIICGDWTLSHLTGGFWIWPKSQSSTEFAEELLQLEEPLEVI